MPLPKTALILGQQWRVTEPKAKLPDNDALCHGDDRHIEVGPGRMKDKNRWYFHEFIHGVFAELGQPLSEEAEEMIVTSIENAVLENFKVTPIKR